MKGFRVWGVRVSSLGLGSMRSHEGCGEMRLLGPSTQEYTHRRIQGLVGVRV